MGSQQMMSDMQAVLASAASRDKKISSLPAVKKALEGDVSQRNLEHLLIACQMVKLQMEKMQIVHFTGVPENTVKRLYMGLAGATAPTGRPPSVQRLLESPSIALPGSLVLRHYLSEIGADNTARMSKTPDVDIAAFLRSYTVAMNSCPAGQGIAANMALHIVKEYAHRNVMLDQCPRCKFVYAFHCEKINNSCPCCTTAGTKGTLRLDSKAPKQLRG